MTTPSPVSDETAVPSATVPVPAEGEVRRMPVTDDEKGVRFQIERMNEFVRHFSGDPFVRAVTEHVILACTLGQAAQAEMRDCAIASVFVWLRANYRFVEDPVDKELIKTPVRMLRDLAKPPEVLRAILGPVLSSAVEGKVKIQMAVGDFLELSRVVRPRCFMADGTPICPKILADCDEAAVLVQAMLRSVGVMTRFRGGGKPGPDGKGCEWDHVWAQALSSRRWVDLDLTNPDAEAGWFHPGFECTETVEP